MFLLHRLTKELVHFLNITLGAPLFARRSLEPFVAIDERGTTLGFATMGAATSNSSAHVVE